MVGSENYNSWRRSMMIALNAKNKLNIITNEYPEPDVNSLMRALWERNNDMIISWRSNPIDATYAAMLRQEEKQMEATIPQFTTPIVVSTFSNSRQSTNNSVSNTRQNKNVLIPNTRNISFKPGVVFPTNIFYPKPNIPSNPSTSPESTPSTSTHTTSSSPLSTPTPSPPITPDNITSTNDIPTKSSTTPEHHSSTNTTPTTTTSTQPTNTSPPSPTPPNIPSLPPPPPLRKSQRTRTIPTKLKDFHHYHPSSTNSAKPLPPNTVYKLKKSLYGLKQANKQWFIKLTIFLTTLGFSQSHADSSLFTYYKDKDALVLLIYVDDILLAGNNTSMISKIKQKLHQAFGIKDLGPLHYYLGIEFLRNPKGLAMTQRKYALDLIEFTGLQNEKPLKTLLDLRIKLEYTDGEPLSYPSHYRTLVGKLIYLTISRPDIAFAAQLLRQGLFFPKTNHPVLHAYYDSDWASCPSSRRSVSGFGIFLRNSLISWHSKKQPVVLDHLLRQSTEHLLTALVKLLGFVRLVLVLVSVLNGSGCLVMLVTSGSASVWFVWFCLVLHWILSGWLCLPASVSCLSEFAAVCLNMLLCLLLSA
ncbi:uncharacterized mitochondrial protein-like protein [Tanacetum coccineum]